MQQAAAETAARWRGLLPRMYPKVARAKELMESGAIGRPVFAEATSPTGSTPPIGLRAWLVDPPVPAEARYTTSPLTASTCELLVRPTHARHGQLSTLVHPSRWRQRHGDVDMRPASAAWWMCAGTRAWLAMIPHPRHRGEIDLTPFTARTRASRRRRARSRAWQSALPLRREFRVRRAGQADLRSSAATGPVDRVGIGQLVDKTGDALRRFKGFPSCSQ